jgi:hypothetical protein
MTTTVVEKTAITPDKSRRRHQDPSWLWMAVFTGSMVLHLLGFLLLRSSDEFTPWFPQTNQEPIAVDLIELDPQATTIAKTPSQKSPASQTPDNQTKTENTNLSLVDTKKNDPVIVNSPTPTPSIEPTPTQQAVEEPTTQPTPTQQTVEEPTTQPISTPKVPPGELPWQGKRQNLQYGEGKELPSELPENLRNTTTNNSQATNPTSPPESNQDNPPQSPSQPGESGENTTTSNSENSPPNQSNPSESGENATASSQENPQPDNNSQPQASGGLIAKWQFLTPQEQRIKIKKDPPPKDLILPQYTGSKEPEINITDNSNQDLPPGRFLISLVIDRNGQWVGAELVESDLPRPDKQKVVNLAQEIFQGETFAPHRFPDDRTPPELSNLFVWITIQPTNSQ